jgi:putative SOS response-associated peptidase YedK
MCGRFTITVNPSALGPRFLVLLTTSDDLITFNAAPTQNLPVITNTNRGEVSLFRWGLIPYWAKDAKIGNKMINARVETLTQKPSFKYPLKEKRCLVIADGFYEWKAEDKKKTPYRITLKDEGLFTMAGLWDTWNSPDGKIIHSFTIITTQANSMMQDMHERMPAILKRGQEEAWLKGEFDMANPQEFLKPYPSEEMRAYRVSPAVNSPGNNGPELILSV